MTSNNTITWNIYNSYNAYFENFIKLGLMNIDINNYVALEGAYNWVEKSDSFVLLKTNQVRRNQLDDYKITFSKNIIKLTALGLEFAKAVVLDEQEISKN